MKKLKLKNIDWVIVGGESGHRARPMDPAWVTDIRDQCAKAGVAVMTQSLAVEWARHGIRLNAIAPGLVDVEATRYVPADRHALYLNQRALQRSQLPEDVSGAVVYALSDLARFVTGQTLAVNGGFVMH